MAAKRCRIWWLISRQVILLIAAKPGAQGWRTFGILPADRIFGKYVGKFCYDFSPRNDKEIGNFTVEIEGKVRWAPAANDAKKVSGRAVEGGLHLAVFDDEERHWETVRNVWHQPMTCQDRLQSASAFWSIQPPDDTSKFDWKWAEQISILENVRPRWWYFTFVSCGAIADGPVSYALHAQNPERGFEMEFSMDEMGLLECQATSLVLFALITIALFFAARAAAQGGNGLRARPILRMLLFSTTCSAAGCLFLTLHRLIYAWNGTGNAFFQVGGELLASVAKATLSVLQLFVAKGRALIRSPEEIERRWRIMGILSGIVLTEFGCELYGRYSGDVDYSMTLYFYASWPGTIIVFLHIALFCDICRSMWKAYTIEASPDIRQFYGTTSAIALIYFSSLPTMCIMAVSFAPWTRRKVVCQMELVVRLTISSLLGICLRPSRLDTMINARLEVPEVRARAVELSTGVMDARHTEGFEVHM